MGERKLQRPAGASPASVGLDQTLRTAEGLLTQARLVRGGGMCMNIQCIADSMRAVLQQSGHSRSTGGSRHLHP